MPDVSIVNTTVTPAPTDYTVPGTQQLLLKAVRASIDGSAAAGSYLPALQLLDPAGHVMWTAVNPADSVAAGASADVSWFPHVGQSGSGSGSAGWTFAEMSAAAIVTVPAWAAGSPGVKNIDMSHANIYTNDSSVFGITTVVLSATTFFGIGVKTPGHYLAKAQVIVSSGDTAGTIELTWAATPGFEGSYGSAGGNFLPIAGGVRGSTQTNPYMEALVTCGAISYPTDPFIVQVANFSGASVSASLDMIAVQLDTDTTTIF